MDTEEELSSLLYALAEKSQTGEVFSKPALALSSPGGIMSGTPESQAHHSGKSFHLSAEGDMAQSVGKRLIVAVKEAWSVFVAKSGIKLFAGNGNINIQAQQGQLALEARQLARLASQEGNVEIAAAKALRLLAGGGQLEIKNGNITLTLPGKFTIKAAQIILQEDPSTVDAPLPNMPSPNIDPMPHSEPPSSMW